MKLYKGRSQGGCGGAPPLRRAEGGSAPNTSKSLKSGLKTRLERLKNRKFSYPRFFPPCPPLENMHTLYFEIIEIHIYI